MENAYYRKNFPSEDLAKGNIDINTLNTNKTLTANAPFTKDKVGVNVPLGYIS
jgi:hypothetical protein